MLTALITNKKQLRSVSSLIVATAVAQLLQLGSTPIITRYFPPEEFAIFQLFFSAASIFAVISTLRYEVAVVSEEKDNEARNLVKGSIGIAIGVGLFVMLILSIIRYSKIHAIEISYLVLVPIYIIAAGVNQTFNNYSIRIGSFNLNFWSRIISSFTQVLTSICLGILGALSAGLMISVIIGQLISLMILLKSFNIAKRLGKNSINIKEIYRGLIKHKDFARFNTPHALIDVLQDHGVILLLGIFFPGSLLAFYGQAYRLLKAPVGFIGAAIHQVFFPDLTRRWQAGENLRPFIKKFYLVLLVLGLPFFGIAGWHSTTIFTWLLGQEWKVTGEIAAILMPWLFLNFIASPMSSISIITDQQGTAMLFAIVELLCRLIAVVIGGITHNIKLLLILMSTIGCLFTIFKMYWYYYISKSKYLKFNTK